MFGFIYCITNNINGSKYIGKTTRTIEERFQEHKRDAYREKTEIRPLYRAMRKYGPENFSITLIEKVELSQLEEREKHWIEYYDTYSNGYNATLGGDGKILYNYSLFAEDYQNGMLIKDIAKKHKCGEDTVRYGLRTCGIVNHKENQLKASSNAVAQCDLDGNILNIFPSQREAARYLISQGNKSTITTLTTNIGRVLKGTRKIAAGYKWKLYE